MSFSIPQRKHNYTLIILTSSFIKGIFYESYELLYYNTATEAMPVLLHIHSLKVIDKLQYFLNTTIAIIERELE